VSYLKLLESELQNFQVELPQRQKLVLATYCEELERWNKKFNLTALSGASLVRRLVLEPVWIARQIPLGGILVDIGSGNGSPAIPFQVVGPIHICHLVEGRVKRAAFLRHLAATLKLGNVYVHRARFEEIAGTLGNADWISLQAVTLSNKLIDSIMLIASPTTNIVWISSARARTHLNPSRTLTVPITGTRVFLFLKLDLS
jgi:16S rRNA (guanine527-N7)-methyltransferase